MVISLDEIERAARVIETGPPRHLSHSRVELFAKCPEAYRQRYLRGVRGLPSEPLATGTMTHAIIGAYYQSLMKKPRMSKAEREQTSLDAAGDIMVGLVDEARKAGHPLPFERDPDDVEEQAVELGRVYIKQRPQHVKPVAIERKIEVDLGDDLPPLVGYVDVEAEASLVEIKTTSRAVSKPIGSWILQGLIYQSAIPKPVEYHVLVKTKEPRLLVSSALALAYDRDQSRRALEVVRHVARSIIRLTETVGPDEAWPMLGVSHPWACSMCDARPACPMGSAA